MTNPVATSWWRPQGFDALVTLPTPERLIEHDDVVRRDGSSADLRDRQRELAFEMYGEALVRMADEDDRARRKRRRKTA
jgi:hypothetical protein